jgi:hypothetical protein
VVQVADHELRFRYRPGRWRHEQTHKQPAKAAGSFDPASLLGAETSSSIDLHADGAMPGSLAPLFKQLLEMQHYQTQQILKGVGRLLASMAKEQVSEMQRQLEPIRGAISSLQGQICRPSVEPSAATVEARAVDDTMAENTPPPQE